MGVKRSMIMLNTTNPSQPIQYHNLTTATITLEAHLAFSTGSPIDDWLTTLAQKSGGLIHILPKYRNMPTLEDKNGRTVFLYELIEAIDGLIDYADIQRDFPALSIGQIDAAMRFIKSMAQYNTSGIDVDELENDFIRDNSAFLSELARAVATKEGTHVLDHG
ncbi:MAG: hypothetical protein HZB53_12650 [Chloroflexi bacterium]|nr:hypothetical protein [Chloroflexota bacterium]